MNRIRISGVYGTKTKFEDNHGEKIVKTILTSKRKSGKTDDCEIVFSELLDNELNGYGKILVDGTIRSRRTGNPLKKNEIYVLANTIEKYDCDEDVNEVSIDGNLFFLPKVRKTPLGHTVSDIPITCKRNTGKTDLISCIAWGRVAESTRYLNVHDKIKITGRLQSRDYTKNNVEFTINEVSASSVRREDENETTD